MNRGTRLKKILIINYGMGNIKSVNNALAYLGYEGIITSDWKDLAKAHAYILPGVGGFSQAMKNFRELSIIEPLTEQVLGKNKPILGICLGMQLFSMDSTEKGFTIGLSWIKGSVKLIKPNKDLRLPHVGWNDIQVTMKSPLFDNIEAGANFYFDHCYHIICNDLHVSSFCEYGTKIVASIQKNNIFGTQFHPEKSQNNGLRVFRNFLNYMDNS